MNSVRLRVGLDVGSTTVKAVAIDEQTRDLLWMDYQRHESGQAEKVLELLQKLATEFQDIPNDAIRVSITGSGGKGLAEHIGAKYVQEVSAVTRAVEQYHPETGSVVELGGQDAKIIILREDPKTGLKNKFLSMNDKCAGGTGAVLDKISAKLGIPAEDLSQLHYDGIKLHHVAGKCGVFAETDINSLLMQGIPKDQLMASLFQALVEQNLAVLTRGHTLRPVVLLLGGPNAFIRGMREAWRSNLQQMWEERAVPLPPGADADDLVIVPANAQYYVALGAVEWSRKENIPAYNGWKTLEDFLASDRRKIKQGSATALWTSREELESFKRKYRKKPFEPASFQPGETVEAFIGLDGGSTSTKGVLLNREQEVLAKAYKLSEGNPIKDSQEIFAQLRHQVESTGASLDILGVGVTGYAADILKDVLKADAAIVETVAHTQSALHLYKDVDVICDVGGQDIKIMVLRDGKVKDFKLNTQCSAGNGYFLQSTAGDFQIPVEKYADVAFEAEAMPNFGYGCAVFLQSDIVNFQRQGWKSNEIMAGLAAVLPKNIWLYVAQIPNMASLGTNFVLQGGTQHNLAAVKAQVDFIKSKFLGRDEQPNIVVHEHCGEGGAIGAALEAHHLWKNGSKSAFIGLDATAAINYTATTNDDTRCHFCKNECLRTFIEVSATDRLNGVDSVASGVDRFEEEIVVPPDDVNPPENGEFKPMMQVQEGNRRLIVGNACEKGSVEDPRNMRAIKKELDAKLEANPNFVDASVKRAYRSFSPVNVSDARPKFAATRGARARATLMKGRSQIRIGIPRLLNVYLVAPLFSAYFESLGVPFRNLVFSDITTGELYREGAKRGAIDPCYPAKLAIPHIHNLIHTKHGKKSLDIVFFPMIDDLPSEMENVGDSRVCPTITATPESVKAAFMKESDLFKEKGIQYLNTFLNIGRPALFERQMYLQFKDILGLSKGENNRAVQAGYAALREFNAVRRQHAKKVLDQLERENRLGIVLLGRPYHNDPGINHDILLELQKKGYPIFTPESLPADKGMLDRLFGHEIRAGHINHPMDISDVWKNAYSEISSRKLWAAKYVARHPNLVALELSNFKCGHDAPIYAVLEKIVEHSGTPYFSFKDLDENKPLGSIKIRIETIDYFLKRYHEDILSRSNVRDLSTEQAVDGAQDSHQQIAPAG
jgi:activator of 2-hydroxyglutaryl-CoA dehydratase/predicted nucleotide-binding protein (sugar kinase/HSP70/actin superfamily)